MTDTQTRRDETGVMTLPLTGYGMDPERSVLETRRDLAIPVSLEIDAYWTAQWSPPPGATDADLLAAAEAALTGRTGLRPWNEEER